MNNQGTAMAEKELATRVVNAAERIKQWCEEIEHWRWTGSFDLHVQDEENPASGADLTTDDDHSREDQDSPEYWGCLPSTMVQRYEDRLDGISDDLADIDMDDLKERILDIHQSNSRPSSSYSTITVSNLNFLDDFSLFVTQTLIQTLPSFTTLRRHLKTWNVRLWVLREVPLYLQQLRDAQADLNQARGDLADEVHSPREEDAIELEQDKLDKRRVALQRHIAVAGNSLDAMLDSLEGTDDTLPDHWIDDFETMEAGLTSWVVDSQKRIFQLRMARHSPSPPLQEDTLDREEGKDYYLHTPIPPKFGSDSIESGVSSQQGFAPSNLHIGDDAAPNSREETFLPGHGGSAPVDGQDALPLITQRSSSEEGDSSIPQFVPSATIVLDTSDDPHTASRTASETTTTPTINIEYLNFGDGQSSPTSHSENPPESLPGLPESAPVHPVSLVEVRLTVKKKMRNNTDRDLG
jgi:hypothetical protein